MLACQRTHPDKSHEAAVQHLLATQPHLLHGNKRIREKTPSFNTSSYSDAHQWLPLPATEWFAGHVSRSLMNDTPPNTRRVFVGEDVW